MKTRLTIVLALLAFAAVASATVLYPTKMERGELKATRLPLELGDWFGQEVPVEDYVKQILETDDVIQRDYISPLLGRERVQLAIVYSADNRRVAHPPEVCYTGAGWEPEQKEIVSHEGLPDMVRLVLAHGQARDLVLYCYKSGEDFEADYYRQQANIILNQLMMKSSASALVRFSTRITGSEEEAERRLLAFIGEMMPEIRKTLSDG